MRELRAAAAHPVDPLVTVGIPTYNRPDGLRRALECVTGQTYRNLEILISDNASPGDETQSVVDSFMRNDSRIIYVRHPINKGAYFNFKFVLDRARGDYFMWFADDDACDSEFVSELVACFQRDDTVALAMSDVRIIEDDSSKVTEVRLSSIRMEQAIRNWETVEKLFFAYPTSNIFFCIYGLYRTGVLKRCKFDFASKWKGITFASEVPILAQVASHGKIVSVPRILKTYVSHPGSMYVKERGMLNRFDRMLRHIEIRLTLTWIAMRCHLKLRKKLPLAVQPWVSWEL
jgi:glycosyltransferase involved in cell wall biosynthesis